MFRGEGRTVVVSGMANPSARFLLEQGFNVVLCAHSQEQADKMNATIPAELQGRFLATYCMIGEPEDTARLIETTLNRFGGFHVLCVGIGPLENDSFRETGAEAFMKGVEANMKNLYSAMKLCIPTMLRFEAPRIINFTTVDGMCGHFNFGAVTAAGKGGLVGLTRAVALEYAKEGLTANCIAVGAMETLRPLPEEERARLCAAIPLGRVATARDIAPIVCFLASEESRYITGAVINASGGAYFG